MEAGGSAVQGQPGGSQNSEREEEGLTGGRNVSDVGGRPEKMTPALLHR